VPTLERALTNSRIWNEYYSAKINQLSSAGFGQASMRWIQIVTFATKIAGGDIKKLLNYMRIYFFDEHLGLGMPEVECSNAALQIASQDSALAMAEFRPTVPTEAAAWQAMVPQMMGPQHGMQSSQWSPHGGVSPSSFGGHQHPLEQMYQSGFGQEAIAQMMRWQQPGGTPMPLPAFDSSQMGALQRQMMGMALPQPLPQPGAGQPPVIEEMPALEQTPCTFCGGAHVQSRCTAWRTARDTFHKNKSEKNAASRTRREEAAAAAAATAAAAAAGATQAP